VINLYEYSCNNCDVVMQIQLSKTIEAGMGCLCGAELEKVFHTEINEAVFNGEGNYEEVDVQVLDMPDNTDN